jgi:heme exporter protein D
VTALLAQIPALPLHEAGKYVAGAYVVLFALVLVYVSIMAIRQSKLERDLAELLAREQRLADGGAGDADASRPPVGTDHASSQRESTPA